MAGRPAGHGITDPVQIRALALITPEQFGILIGLGATTVENYLRRGLIQRFTALDENRVLIKIQEVEAFLNRMEEDQASTRKQISAARRGSKATV